MWNSFWIVEICVLTWRNYRGQPIDGFSNFQFDWIHIIILNLTFRLDWADTICISHSRSHTWHFKWQCTADRFTSIFQLLALIVADRSHLYGIARYWTSIVFIVNRWRLPPHLHKHTHTIVHHFTLFFHCIKRPFSKVHGLIVAAKR